MSLGADLYRAESGEMPKPRQRVRLAPDVPDGLAHFEAPRLFLRVVMPTFRH
jgi:hypothetical protein